jgi:hypothetical protein
MDKFQAEATFCKNGKECDSKHIQGSWSDIYDQSFKVELENGIRFLANFKYSVKPQISEDPTKTVLKSLFLLRPVITLNLIPNVIKPWLVLFKTCQARLENIVLCRNTR